MSSLLKANITLAMFKHPLLTLLFLPFALILTSAWTFELIDKPGSESVVEGMKARDAGRNDEAISYFQKGLAEAVDYQTRASALTQIAALYLAEVPLDAAKALKAKEMLEQAEQLGYPRATLYLGDMYQYGKGVPQDYNKAYQCFNQVKDRYPGALISLAEITADTKLARDYIAQAAKAVEADPEPGLDSTLRLARHFRDGTIVASSLPLAEYWYGRAIQQNSMSAMMELATIWNETGHTPYSDITALWQRASQLGNDRAALELGFAYATGNGVAKDAEQSRRYFMQAVEADPDNAYRIARWYEGREAQNELYGEVAFNWYRVAAAKGHPASTMVLARDYWTGMYVPEDKLKARELYQLAASRGEDRALAELSERELRDQLRQEKLAMKEEQHREKLAIQAQRREEQSRNRLRRHAGGLEYWKPLADKGDAEGMLHVGLAYLHGAGVEQSTQQGMQWIGKAADKGNGEAMYELGQIYSAGLGVSMDVKQAYDWYEKSAKAGYAAGQYQLGLGYARGIGVDEDQKKAREWLEKASKSGYSGAKAVLDSLVEPQG